MDIRKSLETIWSKDYIPELPEIKARGFNFSVNNTQKDILITGINPSFRINEECGNRDFDFRIIAAETKYDPYWTSLKKLVRNEEINLLDRTAYLDIFYFREKQQRILSKKILCCKRGIEFVAEQLNLTQHIIEEVIKPKLIIVKNRESAIYWGRYSADNVIWMGYDLEAISESIFGELYKVKGLINSNERIAQEITETTIKDSLILFTTHINQYTKREKRPTPIFINELLTTYK